MVYKAKIDIQFAEKYWLYKTWPKEILSLGNATTALITQLIDHFSLWKLQIKVIETESLNILELMQLILRVWRVYMYALPERHIILFIVDFGMADVTHYSWFGLLIWYPW